MNKEKRELRTYGWDRESRMTSAEDGTNSVSYAYDALGRRVKRTQGSDVQKYTHDGADVVLDDVNSTLTKYQNAPGIDNKLKYVTGGTSKYFLQDHLGSSVGIANSSGSVTDSNGYDSFGNPTNGSFTSRYQFTGREPDPLTGLQFSRARFYDSRLGKFASEDPIGFAGGDVNLYVYVQNQPLLWNDSLGLFANDLRPFEIQYRKDQCKAMRVLLARESIEGTGPASWMSSVTFGGDRRLDSLNNRSHGNILVNGREFDIDWFMDSNAVSGKFSQVLGPAAYAFGKGLWSMSNYALGQPQTYVFPWQDPGELEAALALSHSKSYKDIFTEEWFKEYCPCDQ